MKKQLLILIFLISCGIVFAYKDNPDDLDSIYERYSIAPDVGTTITYPEGSKVMKIDRDYGYYIDGRGQVPEYNRILPPNDDKIPTTSNPARTVEAFDKYYEINKMGLRRNPIMQEWTPNYNWTYSNRRAKPYTKEEFIDVWCSGEKHLNGVDCQTKYYATTFMRAREWTFGVIKAPIKAIGTGKKAALFLMVDDLGLDAESMQEAKKWGELFKLTIFFGTIDAFIPLDWIT